MTLPPFHPMSFSGNKHIQTFLGQAFNTPTRLTGTRREEVELEDGDVLTLHIDEPAEEAERAVVLLHGLAGDHQSVYSVRLAEKLVARGVRAVRVDMRGSGLSLSQSREPLHGGRSEDIAEVLSWLAERDPALPTTLVGYSLGGNIALKVAGEGGNTPPGRLDSVVAVCPPVDLGATVDALNWRTWHYEKYFLSFLNPTVRSTWAQWRHAADAPGRPARTIREFDERFTAPLCGFRSADEYYGECSSVGRLKDIELPTLIVAAEDDPLVPIAPLLGAEVSAEVRREVTPAGGHIGYISRRCPRVPDRRWIDWRILEHIRDPQRVHLDKGHE